MPFDFNQFVNTSQFSDPAAYAGFNGQMSSVEEAAQKAALATMLGGAGVPPPQSIGEYASQAIAPVQKQFTNMTNAVDQFGQGNFTQGVNALKGKQGVQQISPGQPTTPVVQTKPWDLNTHFGLD
jgi:hypothetical protein